MPSSRIAAVMAAPALLGEPPGGRLNDSVTATILFWYLGATSITTKYWLNGLKMVETVRWPKAS